MSTIHDIDAKKLIAHADKLVKESVSNFLFESPPDSPEGRIVLQKKIEVVLEAMRPGLADKGVEVGPAQINAEGAIVVDLRGPPDVIASLGEAVEKSEGWEVNREEPIDYRALLLHYTLPIKTEESITYTDFQLDDTYVEGGPVPLFSAREKAELRGLAELCRAAWLDALPRAAVPPERPDGRDEWEAADIDLIRRAIAELTWHSHDEIACLWGMWCVTDLCAGWVTPTHPGNVAGFYGWLGQRSASDFETAYKQYG